MSPKVVYLHIGLPKTATSHIQTVLNDRRDILKANGIHYLQAGQNPLFHDAGHHILAASLLKERWEEFSLRVSREDLLTGWETVRAEIEASHCSAFLISSEWFAFDIFRDHHFESLKQALHGFRVAIVVVLRDVVDFIDSAYAQRVRDGYSGTVAQFIEEAWHSLNWITLTGRWADHFGRDNVISLNFESMKGEGIVPSFLKQTFGRDIDVGDIVPAVTNVSLPRHAIEMLRGINASGTDDDLKIKIRDDVKSFFEQSSERFPPGRYVSEEGARLLRLHCEWPRR